MQAHDMNLRKKESFGQPQIQDPSMYFGVNSTIKPSGSGIALYLGSPQEEEHTLGGGNHTGFIASGSSQHHQSSSRNTTFTSSTNQSASAKIVEDHVALFSSCMLAYENFIGAKLTDPETIEEDFNQVDPDDMEDMDIQWNMAMILRRAKRFLNRTGRKFTGGHSNAKVGFDKSKAKCYKCNNFGHFARECQKDKAPASGFTKPSQGGSSGNHQGFKNQNNRNQSQIGTFGALVVQQDDSFGWGLHLEDATLAQTQMGLMAEIVEMMEAEEREASRADQRESTSASALMAIGEASSSSTKFHLDVAYKGLEKKNVEIAKQKNETLQLSGKIEKLKNAHFVVEHYESVVRQMNGLGLGTNAIPTPVSGKRVAWGAKGCENIITDRDNCILTEPDTVESNVKLKLMLYGGFKTIKQTKEETFANHLSRNYQKNIDKYYTQGDQAPEKQSAKPSVSTSGSTQTGEKPVVKLSKPQRRRRKKRLRKLEQQLAGGQQGEDSTSSPNVDQSCY
ncbi:hypothetical protein L1987_30089 [Smallanthus sonchifolius]|uniref:Uncharacterized protein n=1 Tax=Smallanthus sonchifolius TaxID=185202 RepID=A0ACB9I193_9ASTR|nr:hypothetical protein L1987_30089 [Smallanthus sonchifolius]